MICLEDPRPREGGKDCVIVPQLRGADPFRFFAQTSVLLHEIWVWILISQEALSKTFCGEIGSAVLSELSEVSFSSTMVH